eukprot:scaffold9196_cov110-Isochrysis_galbana.AAC.10
MARFRTRIRRCSSISTARRSLVRGSSAARACPPRAVQAPTAARSSRMYGASSRDVPPSGNEAGAVRAKAAAARRAARKGASCFGDAASARWAGSRLPSIRANQWRDSDSPGAPPAVLGRADTVSHRRHAATATAMHSAAPCRPRSAAPSSGATRAAVRGCRIIHSRTHSTASHSAGGSASDPSSARARVALSTSRWSASSNSMSSSKSGASRNPPPPVTTRAPATMPTAAAAASRAAAASASLARWRSRAARSAAPTRTVTPRTSVMSSGERGESSSSAHSPIAPPTPPSTNRTSEARQLRSSASAAAAPAHRDSSTLAASPRHSCRCQDSRRRLRCIACFCAVSPPPSARSSARSLASRAHWLSPRRPSPPRCSLSPSVSSAARATPRSPPDASPTLAPATYRHGGPSRLSAGPAAARSPAAMASRCSTQRSSCASLGGKKAPSASSRDASSRDVSSDASSWDVSSRDASSWDVSSRDASSWDVSSRDACTRDVASDDGAKSSSDERSQASPPSPPSPPAPTARRNASTATSATAASCLAQSEGRVASRAGVRRGSALTATPASRRTSTSADSSEAPPRPAHKVPQNDTAAESNTGGGRSDASHRGAATAAAARASVHWECGSTGDWRTPCVRREEAAQATPPPTPHRPVGRRLPTDIGTTPPVSVWASAGARWQWAIGEAGHVRARRGARPLAIRGLWRYQGGAAGVAGHRRAHGGCEGARCEEGRPRCRVRAWREAPEVAREREAQY